MAHNMHLRKRLAREAAVTQRAQLRAATLQVDPLAQAKTLAGLDSAYTAFFAQPVMRTLPYAAWPPELKAQVRRINAQYRAHRAQLAA